MVKLDFHEQNVAFLIVYFTHMIPVWALEL